MTSQEAYEQLTLEYMELANSDFYLQHVSDAYAAQLADASTKPITLLFSLVGLHLRVEKRLTGRQIQHLHQLLARRKEQWPQITLPEERGAITVIDVVQRHERVTREAAIDTWCASVWEAYRHSRPVVLEFLREHGIQVG